MVVYNNSLFGKKDAWRLFGTALMLCICAFFVGQPVVARAQNPAPVPPAVLAPDVPQVLRQAAQGDQWVPTLVLLNTPATSAEALDAAKTDLLADVGVVGQLQDVADHPLLPVLQLRIKGTEQLMRLAHDGRMLALIEQWVCSVATRSMSVKVMRQFSRTMRVAQPTQRWTVSDGVFTIHVRQPVLAW